MPRQRRLNIPGGVYHIITRGLNRTAIFTNRKDRLEFLGRMKKALQKTNAHCYAWVLMTNHIHLLIGLGEHSIGELMGRVLGGYAIYFNHRHKRCGYLFQNRYKSILCQKEKYLLELVRYIHLNPVRAGLIKTISELDDYPWTGHAVLIGGRKSEWQAKDEILAHFHIIQARAVARYRDFIIDGWEMGKREDLCSGGIRRSSDGWSGIPGDKKDKECLRGDERILGDSDFVERTLKAAKEKIKKAESLKKQGWSIERLAGKVCEIYSLGTEQIRRRARGNWISQARSLLAFWGHKELGLSGKALSQYLGISQSSLSESIARGEMVAKGKSLTD